MKKTALLFAVLICLASVSAINADAVAADSFVSDSDISAKICIEAIKKRIPQLSCAKKDSSRHTSAVSLRAWQNMRTISKSDMYASDVCGYKSTLFFNPNPVDRILYLRE